MHNYKVVTNKENLSIIKRYKVKNIIISDDNLIFYTNKKAFDQIKEIVQIIDFTDLKKTTLKTIFNRYIVTILGLVLISLLLINLSYSITKITFINSDNYDEEVYDYIKSSLRHVGPFMFLDQSINEINYSLRSTFFKYEWIGIVKKGTTLFVQIEKSYHDGNKVIDNSYGNMYAKHDAIIKSYHLERGVIKVTEEQSVAKGDLLISGDIVHYDNSVEKIKPIGYVIGEVVERVEIVVPVKQVDITRSGKIEIKYFWSTDKDESLTSKFENYEVEYETIYQVMGLKLVKATIYEIVEVENYYNYQDAYEYSLSKIYNSFYGIRRLKPEKIVYIKLVKYLEDDSHKFTFLIKSYQNIAEYVE